MEIMLKNYVPQAIKVGTEVMFTKDYLHVDNCTTVLRGERGIVEVVPSEDMGMDSVLTIWMYKQHDSLAEWNNRLQFSFGDPSANADMQKEVENVLIICPDTQDLPGFMLERSLRDLKRRVDEALETIVYGRVDASLLESLYCTMTNDNRFPFPNRYEKLPDTAREIGARIDDYLRAGGYR
jgi:hypothetical protein